MAADGSVSFVERQGTLTAIMLVGFMAANFLSVMFAILLPIDTLSGEIDSGVIQTLASKPIDRAQIVIGKWTGHLLLAIAYLLLLSARAFSSWSAWSAVSLQAGVRARCH